MKNFTVVTMIFAIFAMMFIACDNKEVPTDKPTEIVAGAENGECHEATETIAACDEGLECKESKCVKQEPVVEQPSVAEHKCESTCKEGQVCGTESKCEANSVVEDPFKCDKGEKMECSEKNDHLECACIKSKVNFEPVACEPICHKDENCADGKCKKVEAPKPEETKCKKSCVNDEQLDVEKCEYIKNVDVPIKA